MTHTVCIQLVEYLYKITTLNGANVCCNFVHKSGAGQHIFCENIIDSYVEGLALRILALLCNESCIMK